ncbi:amino acid adenylation domain-containing protein [Streptomyces sp. NBC_00727]|uniref:amino acid adenylation domain-containing protein n=1 Tax=Streptomyces sp. NBC_00727 TaxID=2903675 RepID=UPI003868154D
MQHAEDGAPGEGASSFPLAAPRPLAPTYRRARVRVDGVPPDTDLAAAVAVLLARHQEAPRAVIGRVEIDGGAAHVHRIGVDVGPSTGFGDVRAAVGSPPAGTVDDACDGPRVLVGPVDAQGTRALRRRLSGCDIAFLADREGKALVCDYDTDRFCEETVRRLAEQVLRVAEQGAAAAERPVVDLDLPGEQERQALLALAATAPSDGRAALHRLIARQAAAHPEHIAVTAGGRDTTYRVLDSAADALAARLVRLGAGPGTRVGIRLPRSAELVIAMLAVLKTGAAYVPVDSDQPAGRQQRIADLAGLTALLVRRGDTAPPLDGVASEPVDTETPEPGTVAAVAGPDDPDAPAYVLFTSGSTGRPKGVEVRHANVVRLFDTTRELFGFTDRDVWVNAHSFAFDASVWELYGALLHGGRVVVAEPAVTRDPEALTALVEAERATMLTLSPTAFEGFREASLQAGHAFAGLRHLVLCAEALSFASLARWFDRYGDEQPRLSNMYGITETTVHSSFYPLAAADAAGTRRLIGRPLPDTALYVLDERDRLAPFGVPGEICVGGPGVSAGYLVVPEGARDPFGADPFSSVPGARMYRSGDKGRLLPDGRLEYLGRIDQQVKIRGYRIELGEVDAAFLALPQVRSARAWVVRRPGRPPVLAAALVMDGPGPYDPQELRALAARRLPGYMVPAAVVLLDGLPRTVNGKLDTARLPDPLAEPSGGAADEAEDHRVTRVREAVAAVLGRPACGPDDGFFELGGDSITAVRLVARLRGEGLGAELAHVYALRSPRRIAEALTDMDAGPRASAAPFALLAEEEVRWVPDGAEDAFPATRLQQGMLLHSVLDGERVYHDVLSYTLDGTLDEAALRAAFASVVRRHPVLRTAFVADGPVTPLQVVYPSAAPDLVLDDLTGVAEEERERWLDDWAAAERERPFDWTEPGLLRLFVHRVGEQRWTLSLSVHHCVLDGWSAASLITELLAAHAAVLSDGPAAGAAEGLMGRYLALERAAENDAAQRGFWQRYLSDAEPSRLPGGQDATGAAEAPVATVTVPIPAAYGERIRALARSSDVPVKTAYLAAHAALLALVTGRPEVVTGVVTSGRIEDEGGDRGLGLFLNTLPLRVRGGDQTWRELLAESFLNESRTYPYRRYPFERIQTDAGLGRLCPTAFNYTDFHVYDDLAALGIRLRDIRYREETDFELLVTVNEDPFGEAPAVTLGYRTSVLSAGQARRYGELFVELVRTAGAHPDEPAVRGLADRLARQRRDAAPAAGAARVQPLLSLVAQQVRRAPAEVVQSHNGTDMTYGRLAARVSRLRERLVEHAVRPGTRVACFLRRGHDPLVALLGLWAAGCVYVPVDPTLPRRRQEAMVRGIGCGFALRSADVPAADTAWQGGEVLLSDRPTSAATFRSGAAVLSDGPGGTADLSSWHGAEPQDEAYVLFTSGSTGEPKAVAMPHRAVANLIGWQIAQPEFARRRRISQFAALSFDVSVQEMLTAAAGGGTLVVVPEETRRDPQELLATFNRSGIQTAFLPPVVLHQLATVHEALGGTPRQLETVITAGEALVVSGEIRRLCAAAGVSVVNQYGPTETHVVTAFRLAGDPSTWPERPPIGRPVSGAEVLLLDPLGRPVPDGTPGELHVGGAAVALGYLGPAGQDPASAGRFGEPAKGLGRHYRTGDLVRRANGELEFLGRTDGQMKIRGHRVEPAELASVLLRHPLVADCAVTAAPAPAGGPALAAYVVAAAGGPLTAEALLEHARAELPGYSVPSYVEFLDRLPLTRNGKLDRSALPAPSASPAGGAAATAVERQLLDAWAQVLGRPVDSPTVSFFDAGGTSLLVLPLYLRLLRILDRGFALHDLFRFPTARRFAEFLEASGRNERTGPAVAPGTTHHRRLNQRTPDQILAAARRSRSARGRESNSHD